MMKRTVSILFALLLALALSACVAAPQSAPPAEEPSAELTLLPSEEAPETISADDETHGGDALAPPEAAAPAEELPEGGSYDSKEDVALYLHLYGHLPDNYITKRKRRHSAGPAALWSRMRPASASAETASETTRACCPTRTAAAGRSATSTRSGRRAAARSASSFPTTG